MTTRRRRTRSGSLEEQTDQSVPPGSYRNSTPPRGPPPVPGSPRAPAHGRAGTTDRDMTCRDRTHEFMSAVKSIQSRQGNGLVNGRIKNKALNQRSEFTLIARRIGTDLANTFTKLEKLTILAKRKSLFDDKPIEIQELTYIIKQDIGSLNKQIAQLQELARNQRHQNGRHIQTHSNSVVVSLQSKLASMSSDFKQVLEVRTENLKHQKSRREHFSQSPVANSMPPSAFSGHNGSVLFQDEMNHMSSTGGQVAIDMDSTGDRAKLNQQMQIIDDQDAYIQSRADTMQNIETTIVELGSIFQQLATMVKEQEEMVTRIDDNTSDALLNVEGAHTEILKYFQSVTSNRWLMIKVFAIIIVFFIIFVVFMA